jgi:hypothetical protein
VALAFNPSYSGGRGQEDLNHSQTGKSSEDLISYNKKLDVALHPSYAGSVSRRTVVQVSLGTQMRPYTPTSKKQAKRGMAQVVEYLTRSMSP